MSNLEEVKRHNLGDYTTFKGQLLLLTQYSLLSLPKDPAYSQGIYLSRQGRGGLIVRTAQSMEVDVPAGYSATERTIQYRVCLRCSRC